MLISHTVQSRHLPRKLENDWIELTDHFRWLHCLQFGHCFDFSIFQWCVPKNEDKISFITFPSHFYGNDMIPKRRKWIILENKNFNLHIIFFLTSHFHHIFMMIWWNHTFHNIFQNSFPYHCDENVMEQSSSAKNPKMGHHVFITFLSLFDDISSARRLILNQIY